MTFAGGSGYLGTIFKYQYAPIGIDENNTETNLNIYPNPTVGKINIVCETGQKDANLEIRNMIGQSMLSVKNINLQPGENYVADISSLDNGSCIIRFNNYQKIIIKN